MNSSDDFVAFGLSQYVILNFLGLDFFQRELAVDNDSASFLRADRQMRCYSLGKMLWAARRVEGFARWLQRARNRDFEAAYYELYWLTFFQKVFRVVRFNEGSVKGEDFDLLAVDGAGLDNMNIEVKTRTAMFSSRDSVKDYLNKARSQLPRDGRGAIVFRLPRDHIGVSGEDLNTAILATLIGSSRLVAIGYHYEIVEPFGQGGVLKRAHKWYDKFEKGRFDFSANRRVTSPSTLIQLYRLEGSCM